MAAKFLGQFLLEAGLIDRQQLLDALEAQRASNPMLGELAVAAGMLDAAQAARINEHQRRQDARFGDIAQAMGLLTAAQVSELLARQQAGRRMFGEILIEQGAITRKQLDAALQAQRHDRDEAVQALAAGVAAHRLGAVADAAIGTCAKLFPRLLHTPCQFSQLLEAADGLAGFDMSAHVHIETDRCVRVGLACDAATAHKLAAAFLSIDRSEVDDALARDALGEMANVLMGYVVKDILPDDSDYRAWPPDFGVPASTLARGDDAMAVIMATQHGPLALIIAS
jgi:hypothetical protein